MDSEQPEDGRSRVVIEGVTPEIDGGAFPIKRIVGDTVVVEADRLRRRPRRRVVRPAATGSEVRRRVDRVPMEPLVNDALARLVRGRGARAVPVYGAGLGRSLQDLVARPGEARRGRAGRHRRSADRRGAGRGRGGPGRWQRRGPPGMRSAAGLRVEGDPKPLARRCRPSWPALMATHAERPFATAGARSWRWSSIASGPASARGTSCSRAPRRPSRARHGTFRDVEDRLAVRRRHGLRRAVPAADPPDRPQLPQGPQQRTPLPGPTTRAARGRSAPRRAATERSTRSSARSRTSATSSARPRARHRDGARHRLPVRARSSRTSREHPEWFRAPARRHDPVRREPAEEVPGHLPLRLRDRAVARAVGRAEERRAVLGRAGRADLPRRQPAHQAVRLLGVADRRHQARPIPRRSSWPRRSRARTCCTGSPSSASPSRTTTSRGATPRTS